LITEGTLIVTWVTALIVVILCSYSFLRYLMDECQALNTAGHFFGVALGAVFEQIGTALYAMPNFMFIENITAGTVRPGDGTLMAQWFAAHGYPYQFQHFIAFLMLIGGFCTLWWYLKCHPIFCGVCRVTAR